MIKYLGTSFNYNLISNRNNNNNSIELNLFKLELRIDFYASFGTSNGFMKSDEGISLPQTKLPHFVIKDLMHFVINFLAFCNKKPGTFCNKLS